MCNFEKDELSKCLHMTRVEDARERIRLSQERQKAVKERQKRIEEEKYGKNGYLKKVIEIEAKKETGINVSREVSVLLLRAGKNFKCI